MQSSNPVLNRSSALRLAKARPIPGPLRTVSRVPTTSPASTAVATAVPSSTRAPPRAAVR